MARFIPEWTLNDRAGQPLAQPQEDARSFDRLDSATLFWFVPNEKDSLWSDIIPNAR